MAVIQSHYRIKLENIMDKICKSQFVLIAVLCIVPVGVHAGEMLPARKHAEIRLLLSDDAFDLKMAAKSLQRRTMQDVELSDMLAEKLWQRCTTIDTDKDDTTAWMAKGVAASKQARYLNVIDLCLEKLTHPNSVKHLNLAKSEMTGGDANTFEPGQVAWDKYHALAKQGPKPPEKSVQTERFNSLKYGKKLDEVYRELGRPDAVGGANVSKGRAGHLFMRFNRSGNMLEFRYNGLGAVHFYSEKGENDWIVHQATSDAGLYWYGETKSFIDIKKVMAEARGIELRTLVREFAVKLKRRVPVEEHVYPPMAKRLAASLEEKDGDTLDALSYMCKLLAMTRNGQFYPVLMNVAQNASDSKLKTYAEKYARKLEKYASNTKTGDT